MVSKLLKVSKVGDWEVVCSVPRSNAFRQGVLGPVDIESTVSEVEYELHCQGIQFRKVEKMFKGKKEYRLPTAFFLVEFLGNKLPEDIDFGLCKVRVSPYRRRILQCFKCQRVGHGKDHCKSTYYICPKCSRNHEIRDCPEDSILKCPNCDKSHIG